MNVRSLVDAVKVADATAPYDTIHLKVFYPAQMSGSDIQQRIGSIPVDRQSDPFPIVVFLVVSTVDGSFINGWR